VTRAGVGVAVLSLVSGLGAVCYAAPQSGPVQVEVQAVLASNSGVCDPRVAQLKARLRRLAGFRSYQLLVTVHRTLPWRETQVIQLPGERSIVVQPKMIDRGRIVMQVRLLERKRQFLQTTLRLPNQHTMVFSMGHEGLPEPAGGVSEEHPPDAKNASEAGDVPARPDGAYLVLLKAEHPSAEH
jgi:hypothetical protein